MDQKARGRRGVRRHGRGSRVIVTVGLCLLGTAPARAGAGAAAIDPARVRVPAPPSIPEEGAFGLAGPDVKTAIIIGDEQPKYRFPYWGGHAILARFLETITGRRVPIIKAGRYRKLTPDAYHFRIWVGDQPKIRKAIGRELARIDDDGFVIRRVGSDLYLSGRHKWGTHYAAYDLLERFAGCRWYAPGPRFWQPKADGVVGLFHVVPRAPSVRLPADVHIVEEPSYKMRWMRHMPRHEFRMRLRDRFHHSLSRIIPPAEYGRTHPEFFPQISGKRHVPPTGREHDFQPCISNPDVIHLVVKAAEEHFARYPEQGSFSLGMNDSNRFCQCAKCRALAPPTLTERNPRIAYAFFHFYNEVARRVARKYPGKRLGCLAYAVLSELPAGKIRLHPMIVPYLTRDSAQLFDPKEVAEFREKVNRWSGLAHRMGIYEYVYGGGFVIPRIYNRYILENIRRRYGVGVDGFYGEDYPNWGLDGPKYWLIAKLLWNHKLDPEKLKDEYFSKLFGPAAKHMRDYFDYVEEVWCTQTLESRRSNYRWLNDPKQLAIFPPAKCDRAWAMLARAEHTIRQYLTVLKDEQKKAYCRRIARRIAFFRTSFALTRTLCGHYHVARRLEAFARQDRYLFGEAMDCLSRAFKTAGARREYDAVMALRSHGLTPIYPIDYETFARRYVRRPGVNAMVHRLVEDTIAQALAQGAAEPQKLHAAIDEILRKRAAAGEDFHSPDALQRVAGIAKETGAFFVRSTDRAPVLDGRINPAEWGLPTYTGRFFKAFTLERAPHKTTIWAVADAKKLYLAFDCEGDPGVIGADVAGRDTDLAFPAKMAHDDAVGLCLVRPKHWFQRIRVNVNGSIQDSGSPRWDVCEAKATRTRRGWQVEMAIDVERTNAARKAVAVGPTWICISRYYRLEPRKPAAPARAACTTLAPIAPVGGTVGRGNHPHLMAFVWGPRVVYR